MLPTMHLNFLTRSVIIHINNMFDLQIITRACYSHIWMKSVRSLMTWGAGTRKMTRSRASSKVGFIAFGICTTLTVMLLGEGNFDRSDTGKSIPVNPLAWWHAQRLAGEEHDGLTQMAIDVHSTPGKPRACLH